MNDKLFNILREKSLNTKELYKALVAEYPALEEKPVEKPAEEQVKKTVKKKTVKK